MPDLVRYPRLATLKLLKECKDVDTGPSPA
jgi:hypothetical protein